MSKILSVAILLLCAFPAASSAHEVDPTTLERARRDVFKKARSWKIFERTMDAALLSRIRAESGARLSGEEATRLTYHVAFSSERPGGQQDVLGVMVLREIHTENGITGIAVGITVRGRISSIVGVEGPDRRAVGRKSNALVGKTLRASFAVSSDPTERAIAAEAHAILLATKILLGSKTREPPPPRQEEPEPAADDRQLPTEHANEDEPTQGPPENEPEPPGTAPPSAHSPTAPAQPKVDFADDSISPHVQPTNHERHDDRRRRLEEFRKERRQRRPFVAHPWRY